MQTNYITIAGIIVQKFLRETLHLLSHYNQWVPITNVLNMII